MVANPTDTSQSDDARAVSAIDTDEVDRIAAIDTVTSDLFMVVLR